MALQSNEAHVFLVYVPIQSAASFAAEVPLAQELQNASAVEIPPIIVSKGASTTYTPPDDSLRRFLDTIGTSGCISLLQKAIRRRPLHMQHPETEELFSTVEVVRRIARRSCCGYQQGFFLPNIGKFVSGFQHFLKRLFIIAAEDSIYDVENMFDISMCALLASLQPTWVCSPVDIERIVSIFRTLEQMVRQQGHYNDKTTDIYTGR